MKAQFRLKSTITILYKLSRKVKEETSYFPVELYKDFKRVQSFTTRDNHKGIFFYRPSTNDLTVKVERRKLIISI